MMQTLTAKVDEAVEQNAPENAHPSEWDVGEMLEQLDQVFPLKREIAGGRSGDEGSRGNSPRCSTPKRVDAYEAKEKEVTPEVLRLVEQRYLLLPIIDRQWVDHLYVMDHLKTGIGLRGYGQKDPRVEYEKEAFEIFESLKNNISDEAIKGVFRVVIEQGPPPTELHAAKRPARNSSRFRRANSSRSPHKRKAAWDRRKSSNSSGRCPAPTAGRSNCTRTKTTNRVRNPFSATHPKSAATNSVRAAAERNTRNAMAPQPKGSAAA